MAVRQLFGRVEGSSGTLYHASTLLHDYETLTVTREQSGTYRINFDNVFSQEPAVAAQVISAYQTANAMIYTYNDPAMTRIVTGFSDQAAGEYVDVDFYFTITGEGF
ncbi:MAG: hypothetical protein ETSY1_12800 [Candidatus Entotheonella factor]|uniref:Uncharacterized protein n=1 Tax=Entotheonella factor TaxID=1429438 RepID=W4LQ65_ENTF1|nr:MAG: hypothetical protein ETSY1_12800 [Candidatus Entotheonella factor]